MPPRIALARLLKRLGRFVSSLALMVVRPDDLMEVSRQVYLQQAKFWGSDETINKGFHPLEKEVLEKINISRGRVLVLDVGGGREAIALAKMGFSVTGVDFIPEMIDMAKANAVKHGVQLTVQLDEFTDIVPPPDTYDLIWLSDKMYSSIGNRKRRVEMLRRMWKALRQGGWFICSFSWKPVPEFSPRMDRLRKLFAYMSRGNLRYEPGDTLYGELIFFHDFRNKSELSSEFAEGGFKVIPPYIINDNERRGIALLSKG